MPQIELGEQDLQKLDELVKNGVSNSREGVIKVILETLSLEEIKGMERAKHIVDMYLPIYEGDMLYPLTPLKAVVDGKEMYKVPVKSYSDENYFHGYVYVDAQTMEIDINLSTGWECLPNMSDEELAELKKIQILSDNYCESRLDNMYAGVPRKVTIEDKEYFEVLVKRKEDGKTYIYGGLFIDAETLAVEEMIHKSKERVHEVAEMIR